MEIKLNPDKELVAQIRQRLQANKEKYGKQYCPCVLPPLYSTEHGNDYVCMCKEFREQEDGMCHCGLYIKIKD